MEGSLDAPQRALALDPCRPDSCALMPKSYAAAVMPGPNKPIEVREFREPELEPGAALLQTMYSEVCGTDVHLHHGKLAGVPYPIIPGHVSVGRVAKTAGRLA